MSNFQFQKDGYVVINDFLSEEEIKELRSAGEALAMDMPDSVPLGQFSTVDNLPQVIKNASQKINFDQKFLLFLRTRTGTFWKVVTKSGTFWKRVPSGTMESLK
jgi:hypothetical protein